MKGIKANTVDLYLKPLREQIVDLVPEEANVIELGCGSGDQLMRLSHKIKYGIGFDKSEALIQRAMSKSKSKNITNCEFYAEEIDGSLCVRKHYEVAIASLFFHVVTPDMAMDLINRMKSIADRLLICAFESPENRKDSLLLWFDQRFTEHYETFKEYQKNDYMIGLLEKCKIDNFHIYNTFDPVIKIFDISL